MNKENILDICKLSGISQYGDLYDCKIFKKLVYSNCIDDCDGDGSIVISDKEVKNSSLSIDDKINVIIGKTTLPIDLLIKIFGNELKIIWYNR